MDRPEISVLIASRNRPDSIGVFLDIMESVTCGVAYEIIIADNSTIDHTSQLLCKYGHRLPLRVIYVPKKGKSRSLNLAIAQAKADLLVFADDDIRPDRDWLQAYKQAADQRPDINVFGGRILVDRKHIPEWIIKSYNLQTILLGEQDYGDESKLFGLNEYPVGPNIAVRRHILQHLPNPWPEHIGPGTGLPVGDEIFFLRKASDPVSRDRLYVPDSIVYHDYNKSNLKFINAYRRCYAGGYAAGLHNQSIRVEASPRTKPTAGLIRDRILTCKSLRELLCMTSRATGYYVGTNLSEFSDVDTHQSGQDTF